MFLDLLCFGFDQRRASLNIWVIYTELMPIPRAKGHIVLRDGAGWGRGVEMAAEGSRREREREHVEKKHHRIVRFIGCVIPL